MVESDTTPQPPPVHEQRCATKKSDGADHVHDVRGVRGVVAMLLLAVLLAWPAWSLFNMQRYLHAVQPKPADAQAGWQMLARRFAPVRRAYPPGTVLAFKPSDRTYVAPSRMHDVNFVCIPLVVTDIWYDKTDLVLADLVNDNELADLIKRDKLTIEHHFGPGVAVLRRPSKKAASPAPSQGATP